MTALPLKAATNTLNYYRSIQIQGYDFKAPVEWRPARAESNTPKEKEEGRKEKGRMQLKPTIWDTQDGEVGAGASIVAFLWLLLKFGEGMLFYGKERENVSQTRKHCLPLTFWITSNLKIRMCLSFSSKKRGHSDHHHWLQALLPLLPRGQGLSKHWHTQGEEKKWHVNCKELGAPVKSNQIIPNTDCVHPLMARLECLLCSYKGNIRIGRLHFRCQTSAWIYRWLFFFKADL